jgi:hypothetical protein
MTASASPSRNKGWDNVRLSTKKIGALAKVSKDLIEDAVISVVDDMAQERPTRSPSSRTSA